MFWHAHGHLGEGRKWLEAALAKDARASVGASAAVRIEALEALFWLTYDQWDQDRAEAVAQEAMGLSDEAEIDSSLAASLRIMLAGPAWVGGDYERGKELLEERLATRSRSQKHSSSWRAQRGGRATPRGRRKYMKRASPCAGMWVTPTDSPHSC